MYNYLIFFIHFFTPLFLFFTPSPLYSFSPLLHSLFHSFSFRLFHSIIPSISSSHLFPPSLSLIHSIPSTLLFPLSSSLFIPFLSEVALYLIGREHSVSNDCIFSLGGWWSNTSWKTWLIVFLFHSYIYTRRFLT